MFMIIDFEHWFDDVFNKIEDKKVTRLYKYMSFGEDKLLNDKKIETVKNSNVYMSSPLAFNDPYDCELSFNIMDGLEEFLKISLNRKQRRTMNHDKDLQNKVEESLKQLQDELTAEWNKIKDGIQIACFCEKVDNFLMWSHYANCYNGICIEYDVNKINMCNEPILSLFPVMYTDNLIKAWDYFNKEELYKKEPRMFQIAAIRAVISKHLQWSYENEWRMISIGEKDIANYKSMPAPEKIYIGFKVEESIRNRLLDISNELKVDGVYETKISTKEYKLIHNQIK